MNPRNLRSAPLLGLVLVSALGLPALLSGCSEEKAGSGAQAPAPVIQAQEDSAKAAEEFAKSQQKK